MLNRIPLVHGGKNFVGLMDCQDRPLGQDLQVLVGNHGCNLENTVMLRVQTGHFKVDPDQVLWVLHAEAPHIARHISLVAQPRPFTATR